ncbi:histidine phosphatase family protein [Terasakiella sp. A23]|uniref:SixA phosphatase family protein n=1 Tax=Terasakiella sp. FCG-A23 TaxID=3080561 RepID=UPI00295412A1|nr:histidine phosphatase family protein [Terasakiella sp. A23]MDV7340558.1 histidine phosphatase family protein [Terasakiella sp. A23]
MKNLLLLRHAKSSWANPELIDFDRPLNGRGNQAAEKMAVYLSENVNLPDCIFCSTAQRTRETLGYLLKVYPHPIRVELTRDLYMASHVTMMGLVQAVEADVETLMLIAHNPGIEDFAAALSKPAESEAMQDMLYKYPTAACAHLQFDVKDWADVSIRSGELKGFVKPRDL